MLADEIDRFRDVFGGPKVGGLALDQSKLLAIILLHEASYLHYKDYLYARTTAFDVRELDYSLESVSNREMRADLFAVTKIRSAFRGKWPNAFVTSVELSMTLSDVSFNFGTQRMLDHFAADALLAPSLYADGSYDHANLELRFLTMNYRFYPGKASHHLLEQYLNRRKTALSNKPPAVLYMAEKWK